MIWKKKVDPEPESTRWVRRFAWLPTTVGEYCVWLGNYYVKEVYSLTLCVDGYSGWHEYRWRELLERNLVPKVEGTEE